MEKIHRIELILKIRPLNICVEELNTKLCESLVKSRRSNF